MKHKTFTKLSPWLVSLCFIISLAISSFQISAYDFEVDGVYYNVLSLDDMTCEVTYNVENKINTSHSFYDSRGTNSGSSSMSGFYPSYKGKVTVPETVTYKGRTLTVTGIGKYAFLSCTELTELSLPSTINEIAEITVNSSYSCYAGAFDYCKIEKFTAGNAYVLKMFDHSYATGNGYQTRQNLQTLILAEDFSGSIEPDFSSYTALTSINSYPLNVPTFSSGTHFSNNQYLNVLVSAPSESFDLYKTIAPWSCFWDLISLDDRQTPPNTLASYDFEVDGIYYNVLSLDDMTCEVT